jgi:uncharacterized protein
MDYKGMTALVTGASAGLGEEFARQLASRGCNLILVARSRDKLARVAAELRQRWKTEVAVMPADLASAEAVQRLIAEIKRRGTSVSLLVNNAGFGIFDNFLDAPLQRQMEQVDVNVRSLVTLTHAFTPGMVATQRGGVINIASSAASQPLAGADVYAASKAFVLFFSEGLSLELGKSNVRVLAACPGPVATQFFASMNPKMKANQMDQPTTIVREILRAFDKGKKVVVPGKLLVRLGTVGARLLPRNTILRLAAGTVQQLNRK